MRQFVVYYMYEKYAMVPVFTLVTAVAMLFLVACSGESTNGFAWDVDCSNVDLKDDFIYINSAGKSVVLGTTLKSAKSNERPEMGVAFDYSFLLGKNEITCKEFNDLMGGKKGHLTLDCDNESLPAANVTYYDAVLFANAKSKKNGIDSAYSYSSAQFDKNGHCVLLEGFKFKPEVDAFRLPTEAEWVFASGLSFDSTKSWNSSNSDFATHEVCLKKDKKGFCDLSGNVAEWVNDWLGNFQDTVISNYMGALNGGNFDERVIKGGSFRSDPSTINLYSRGDVYTVTSASYSDYLGFRLAYGKIAKPVWLDASGEAISSNILVLPNRKMLSSLLGTNRLKLAFRNDVSGNLVYVDLSKISPVAVEIKDSLEVYHPDISPDGKHVAFCTGLEGIAGKSTVYVRDLNEAGTNLVKLDVKSAAIPRWRVLENGDTVIVYVTDAGNNKEKSDFFSQSTWQVPFSKGAFGKPVKLFDGAYHGGISNDEKLSVSGARLLRARVAKNKSTVTSKAVDTVWFNSDQACNASLNRTSKQTLFLDFAGKTGTEFVGKSYQVHERLLVADEQGKLRTSVAAPKGYTFDHSEWVLNEENFAVVTLTNFDGAHQKIALVNIKTGSITNLVEGDELWHPCFWTPFDKATSETSWSEDSVGVYLSAENQSAGELSRKMLAFWTFKDSIELIGLGNSRVRSGFNPLDMSVPSLNFSAIPCDMHCIHYLFKNYVLSQCPKLKYVVVSLDFDMWSNYDEHTDVNWNIGGSLGFEYDKNHEFYPEGVDSSFVNLVRLNSPAESEDYVARKGWFESLEKRGWTDENGVAEIDIDSAWSTCLVDDDYAECVVDNSRETCYWTYHLENCMPDSNVNMCLAKHPFNECLSDFFSNYEKLKDLVRLAKMQNITVVGVTFPVSPYYKKTGSYSRHGMLRSHAEKLIEEMRRMEDENLNFIFMDENKMGNHDYPSSMAHDYDHLNKFGAEKFSARLDSLIKSLQKSK